MTDKEYIISLLKNQNKELEIENALLKQAHNRKAVKNKWGKVPYRKRQLKLISANGLPPKGGAV